MQALGPRQEAWLKALESGDYKQTEGQLHNPKTNSFCCLGVACKLMGNQLSVTTNKSWNFVAYGGERSYLPTVAMIYYGFRKEEGDFVSAMNDRGKSFKEIAARVRKDPAVVFKEVL